MKHPEKLKILLVDNDEVIQIYFKDIFWIYGFNNACDLAVVPSIDDAKQLLADPAKRPGVIFLGLALPHQVGDRTLIDTKYSFDFLERIKHDRTLKSIKVMIFSVHAEKELQEEAKEKGADGYIHKEESLPKDLVAILHNLVDGTKTS